MLDFRYMTPHDRVTLKNRDVWQQATAAVKAQFCFAGPCCIEAFRMPSAVTPYSRLTPSLTTMIGSGCWK